MKASIEIDVLSVSLPIDHPVERSYSLADGLSLEVRNDAFWAWDYPCRLQSTIFAFDPKTHPNAFAGLIEMPHLDEAYRALAVEAVANRGNLVGAHLEPAILAMEAAIAARDGSSVYFIDGGGRIKIGWSRKVSARLAQLQTGAATQLELLATVPGGLALERRLHKQFHHLRLAGEWFLAAPELLDHIAKACADHQARLAEETS